MGTQLDDQIAYQPNKCSENARQVDKVSIRIIFDLWNDNHYLKRIQHGDDNGKREGIAADTVNAFVKGACYHLLYYASNVPSFNFLNHGVGAPDIRTVLKDTYSGEGTLNVVIETHFVAVDCYEVTVVTALRADDFKIGNGQFFIEFDSENTSTLKRLERGGIRTIASCEE